MRFLEETLTFAENIDRRVVVPVVVRMALGANPVADVSVLDSRKLFVAETALGANLCRWIEPPDFLDNRAALLGNVLQDFYKLAPCLIVDLLPVQFDHSDKRQVLDTDERVPPAQIPRELEEPIPARILDMPEDFGTRSL